MKEEFLSVNWLLLILARLHAQVEYMLAQALGLVNQKVGTSVVQISIAVVFSIKHILVHGLGYVYLAAPLTASADFQPLLGMIEPTIQRNYP